jgi:hypothetical protein
MTQPDQMSLRALYLLYRLSQHKFGWLYKTASDAEAVDELEEAGLAKTPSETMKLEVTGVGRLNISDVEELLAVVNRIRQESPNA